MSNLEITEALKKAVNGNKSAFTYIYEQTCSELYSFAFGLCRNHDVAEDLLQETYIDAFVKLKRVYTSENLMRWLKGILINEWREYVRHEKRSPMLSYDGKLENEDDLSVEISTLQEYVEKNETGEKIWNEVNALPEKQRICVLLFYYNEMSVEEISALLQIPEGSVKSRLHYSRNKLAKKLNKNDIQFNATAPTIFGGSKEMLAQILQVLESTSQSAALKFIGGSAIGGLLLKFGVGLLSVTAVGGLVFMMYDNLHQLPSRDKSSVTSAYTTSSTIATTTTATTTTTVASSEATQTTTTTQAATVTFDVKEVNGGVAIEKYTGNSVYVNIPKTIGGKKVISIADSAFQNNHNLRSVSIPSTVRSVGSNTFRGCKNLRQLSIARGVNSIGEAAFLGCTSLQTVVVPSSVNNVGFYAFAYCTTLKEVKFNDGLEVLNYRAFIGCEKLSRVTLPSTVTIIGEAVFVDTAPELLLRVKDGSYASQYAMDNGFNYELI